MMHPHNKPFLYIVFISTLRGTWVNTGYSKINWNILVNHHLYTIQTARLNDTIAKVNNLHQKKLLYTVSLYDN